MWRDTAVWHNFLSMPVAISSYKSMLHLCYKVWVQTQRVGKRRTRWATLNEYSTHHIDSLGWLLSYSSLMYLHNPIGPNQAWPSNLLQGVTIQRELWSWASVIHGAHASLMRKESAYPRCIVLWSQELLWVPYDYISALEIATYNCLP